MKAVATLTSSESRRLIAKAVVQMKEVKRAWENAYLLLADGTTNAFIAQELQKEEEIIPQMSAIGFSADGVLCVNSPKNRRNSTNVFYKGKSLPGRTFSEALADFHEDTVVIKGANAIDTQGMIGIITTGFDGGTIPRVIGPITSKGTAFITPVGLEKLVPSVTEAAKAFNGAKNIDISLGASGGMFCLDNTLIITEIEAAEILFGAKATLVSCGGIGGNQGAVTLVFEGEEKNIRDLIEFLEMEVKGEPPIDGSRGNCGKCRYESCRYQGYTKEELPIWMKKTHKEERVCQKK